MEEEQNSGTLDGTTEPAVIDAGRVFVNTSPNYPIQKNAAAKVIGILVIIWGAFNLLGSPLTLLSDIGATDLNGNEINYPICLLYTSPSPRDATLSRMPSSA